MAHCNGHGTKGTCIECELPQLARNHYFTGKLLVERDFSDEQRYHMGKQRRHNQLLHGWGTVCGLKVKQHPTEACRDQYVVIEPGMALDCCGREIVTREEYFDFREALEAAWRAANPETEPDGSPQTFRICLRYKECPTEDVPALFDECGRDGEICQPNRILETYGFGVLLGEPEEEEDLRDLEATWRNTLCVARPVAAAVLWDRRRLIIASLNGGGTLHLVNIENHTIVATRTLGVEPLDVAISSDGRRAYVSAWASEPPGADAQVFVVDLNSPTLDDARPPLPVTGAGGGTVRVAPVKNGGLAVLNTAAGTVAVWDEAVNSDPGATPVGVSPAITGASSLATTSDGDHLYVGSNSTGSLWQVDLADPAGAPREIPLLGGQADVVAAVHTAEGDDVAALEVASRQLRLLGYRPGATPDVRHFTATDAGATDAPISLTDTPVAAVFSPSGQWLIILGHTDDAPPKARVQAVNSFRVQLGLPVAPTQPVVAGENGQGLALTQVGRTLYLPYLGPDPEAPESGGVAILDVEERSCAKLLEAVLDPCPECGEGEDCVVLATIHDVALGADDPAARRVIADKIDNQEGRKLLASTSLLAEVIECMRLLKNSGGSI
ncbi:MAG: YncE family protein [Anaerolineae bacterium]